MLFDKLFGVPMIENNQLMAYLSYEDEYNITVTSVGYLGTYR